MGSCRLSQAKAQPVGSREPDCKRQAEERVPFDGIPLKWPDLGRHKVRVLSKLQEDLQLQQNNNDRSKEITSA